MSAADSTGREPAKSRQEDAAGASGNASQSGARSQATTSNTVAASTSADSIGDMTTDVESECSALLAWVQAVDKAGNAGKTSVSLSKNVDDIDDLCDGTAFFDLLASVDGEYFRNPHSAAVADTADNWVLKTATLKRMYKLIVQYYSEVLRQSPQALSVPDLDGLARDGSHTELARLGRFVLGIAVRSERADEHISAIQTLDLAAQQQLMHTIEQVMAALEPLDQSGDSQLNGKAIKTTPSQEMLNVADRAVAAEKRRFEQSYSELMQKHRTLQSNLDDVTAERDEATKELERIKDGAPQERPAQTDRAHRQEVERLRDELRKSEDNLAEVERELASAKSSLSETSKRSSELQSVKDENVKLKDQVEELKHAADKLQRTENVMEKYKKKLEEGGEVRRQLKTLEEQNNELLEKNAALEDDYRRVSQFKPLMDQYKSQMAELETKASNLQRDLNAARYEAEQTTTKLRATEEARIKEKEELDLYQERVTELELGGVLPKSKTKGAVNGATGLAEAHDGSDEDKDETLQDAMSETTMAGLKIQLRKARRELAVAQANKADASKLLVTENLLQDANSMKARYERDYLREYQAALKLRKQLDAIQTGKSDLGDGAEANIALRMRLNEAVEELDGAKKKLIDLEAAHEKTSDELAMAKSDLHLVGKDKLEMIAEVRASVNVEKADLERTLAQVRQELGKKDEEIRMHLSQVNSLLMDKVDLQNDGMTQRDLALQRELERDTLQLLENKNSSNASAEAKRQLEERAEENKTLRDKLAKARAFIRQQDRLLKEGGSSMGNTSAASSSVAADDEGATLRRVATLEQENKILRQEQRCMASAWYDLNLRYMRTVGGDALGKSALASAAAAYTTPTALGGGAGRAHTRANVELNGNRPKSWLLQQRSQLAPGISLSRR